MDLGSLYQMQSRMALCGNLGLSMKQGNVDFSIYVDSANCQSHFVLKLKRLIGMTPGQIIHLYDKVIRVVDILHLCVTCPRGIEIEFKNGQNGKWFLTDRPTTTTKLGDKSGACDYEAILFPFLILRNIYSRFLKIILCKS